MIRKHSLTSLMTSVEFINPNKKIFFLLEGDQATYQRLQSIRALYGNDLSWMIPFPGDWHCLKNYQEVLLRFILMQVFVTWPKLVATNQTQLVLFHKNPPFLLEVWESIYRLLLSPFLSDETPPDFLKYASDWIIRKARQHLQESG